MGLVARNVAVDHLVIGASPYRYTRVCVVADLGTVDNVVVGKYVAAVDHKSMAKVVLHDAVGQTVARAVARNRHTGVVVGDPGVAQIDVEHVVGLDQHSGSTALN